MAEQLVEALDVRVHVGREAARRQAVGDGRLTPASTANTARNMREQRQLGADHAPEDVAATEPVVPQEVDVEAGDGPPEHDDDQEEDADGDEDGAPGDPPSGPPTGEVRGTPHGRERYPSVAIKRQRQPGCIGGAVWPGRERVADRHRTGQGVVLAVGRRRPVRIDLPA